MDKIEIKNVSFSYKYTSMPALSNISYTFERGMFYGVIGENGSGKTTFCNLLRGLIPSFYRGELLGEILFDNVPLKEMDIDELSINIGYVFQNPFTQISGVKKTVFEEVAIGLENLGVPPVEIVNRVSEILEQLDIAYLAEKNPNNLSGGQRQRVAFASIIAMDPDILVIDEPTSQLDPEGAERIFSIIHSLKEKKKTIILVEHKINMIANYCDKVLVLKDGKLVCTGDTQEVLSDPALHNYGIQLPEAAQVAYDLATIGLPLSYTTITDKDCCDEIKKAGYI